MGKWRRFFLFIVIMTAIVVLVGGTTTIFLYNVALNESRERLEETAISRARIIESVWRFNRIYNLNHLDGPDKITLSQIIDAHRNFKGFGDTGEFVLARRVDNQIVFVLSHRHFDLDNPKPVPFDKKIAEPMRRALLGRSGTLVGLDYRGERVLAAHEPVAGLNMGLVAKIDLSEIRRPFLEAGLFTLGFAILAIIVGAGLFNYVFNYMVQSLETNRRELRENQRLLQTVFDTIPNLIIVKDRESRYLMVNRAMAEAHGLQPEQLLDVRTEDAVLGTGQERQEFLDEDRQVFESGERMSWSDVPFTSPNGEARMLHVTKLPLRDDSGEIVGLVSVSEDVTERIRADQELRRSEERFREIAEISSDWFWEMGPDLRITWVSDRHEELTGVNADFVIGKRREELAATGEEPEKWDAHMRQLNDRQPFRHFRFLRTGPDGNAQYLSVSGTPNFDDSGNFLGYRGTGSDLTEHYQLEEQLRHSQKMEAVGQLAGGVAHEFNNVLQIILGSTDIALAGTPEEDKRHKILQMSRQACERGARLVRQLLGFSRRERLQPRKLTVNEVISGMVPLIASTIGEQIELKFNPDPAPIEIHADRSAIEQILVNLCINARDAMPDGGTLRIETKSTRIDEADAGNRKAAKPGDYAQIKIADSGEGMTSEVMERIFEPFFTTKGTQEGSGLGLSLVYGLVEQHGGFIDVSSEPGSGTAFDLFLPMDVAGDSTAMEPSETDLPAWEATVGSTAGSTAGSGEVLPPALESKTILVAEDEEELQMLTTRVLQERGFNVISAVDGEHAVALVEANGKKIDLILMDLVMPKMGGREAFTRIREMLPDVPVVFQSGYDVTATDSEFLSQPGLTTLQKPYAFNELLRVIQDMLA